MTMHKKWRGFSLVELMIAMLLGTILLFGITQIFTTNKQSNTLLQTFARVQESGRTATELLQRDIRMADYWGCLHDRGKITNHLDTTDTHYVDWIEGNPIAGLDNASAATPAIGGKTVLVGTDVLTLKTAADLCAGKGRLVQPATAGTLQVSAGCAVTVGQAALVSNCQAGELFTVSGFATQVIGHNTTYNDGHAIKNTSAFSAAAPAYGPESKLLAPLKRVYFLAANDAGNTTLYRCDDACPNNAAQALVSGIEDLQIEYGEDTDGNGTVDVYRGAGSVVAMSAVRSLRIRLSVLGNEAVGGQGDGKLHKPFTVIADIRNRSLK
jgi:type IV pilus assembly protein PilW